MEQTVSEGGRKELKQTNRIVYKYMYMYISCEFDQLSDRSSAFQAAWYVGRALWAFRLPQKPKKWFYILLLFLLYHDDDYGGGDDDDADGDDDDNDDEDDDDGDEKNACCHRKLVCVSIFMVCSFWKVRPPCGARTKNRIREAENESLMFFGAAENLKVASRSSEICTYATAKVHHIFF